MNLSMTKSRENMNEKPRERVRRTASRTEEKKAKFETFPANQDTK